MRLNLARQEMKLLNWDDFDLEVYKSPALRMTKSELLVWKHIQSFSMASRCFLQYAAGYHTLNGSPRNIIFDFAFPEKKLAIEINNTTFASYTYGPYPCSWKVLVLTESELRDPGLGQLIKNFLQ